MPEVGFRLIGTFEVSLDGRALAAELVGSRKARVLLQVLAVARGQLVPTEDIVGALWPGGRPARPGDSVATLVSRLRRVLGAEVLLGGRGGYALADDSDVRVDIAEAERWVAQAQALLREAPALSVVAAGRALDLLGTGELLSGEPEAEWAESARRAVRLLLHRAQLLGAEAALRTGAPAGTRDLAEMALAADPFDESATRLLMRAHQQGGEPAAALAAYERLRAALARELGTDPAPETREVHLAVLREQQAPAPTQPAAAPAGEVTLIGREAELARLSQAWAEAAAGRPALWVVTGEAGIGKTRLAEEVERLAAATGGEVLHARSYETERSLFLQPVIEAIGGLAARMPPALLRDLAGERAPVLAALVPEIGAVLGPFALDRGTMEVERRRAYDAVLIFLRRLSARSPVLLVFDDLHHSGIAVTGLLHYLARHAGTSRLLIVGTVRTGEGDEALSGLADTSSRLDLTALAAEAVIRLAQDAGQGARGEEIARRTGGNSLYVVETLRGLGAGETDLPDSLQAVVLARVQRAGEQAQRVLGAAAVLGSSFEPAMVGTLLDLPEAEAVRQCEGLLRTRLIAVAERAYEFAHEVVREALMASIPAPTLLAYHQRAADLLTTQPEAMAFHAAAAGDWGRAARGWLLAAEQAMQRFAAADAERLLDRAVDGATRAAQLEVAGGALLLRGNVRETLARYDDALADYAQAAVIAREHGDRRLEMQLLRALGGDAAISAGRSAQGCLAALDSGLLLAESLGDRRMQAEFLARLAVVMCSELRFDAGVESGGRALAVARVDGDELALASALDGAKTGYAYLGEVAALEPILAELEPLVRRQGDLWRLQWAVFESSFPFIAAADWPAAGARIEAALTVNRRSGHVGYERWLTAHLGWLARLQGRYDDAVGHGRRAIAAGGELGHAWYFALASAMLAATLLEVGDTDEAIRVLRSTPAGGDASPAYRLRTLAALAEATGSSATLAQADALLRSIEAPPGGAWLLGADAYFGVARAWLANDVPDAADRAGAALAPLMTAAERHGWLPLQAEGALLLGRCAVVADDIPGAREAFTRAGRLAAAHAMAGVARLAEEHLR
ncbi:MAG: AAA family ATPase [Pseudonocardiales bacterium]